MKVIQQGGFLRLLYTTVFSLFIYSSVIVTVYAGNPSQPFSPQDKVIDPTCVPTDSNCYIDNNNQVITNATTTTLYSAALSALSSSFSGNVSIASGTSQLLFANSQNQRLYVGTTTEYGNGDNKMFIYNTDAVGANTALRIHNQPSGNNGRAVGLINYSWVSDTATTSNYVAGADIRAVVDTKTETQLAAYGATISAYQNNSGTTTYAHGIVANTSIYPGRTGTMVNATGLYVDILKWSGNIRNSYGLYINSSEGTDKSYGVYQNGGLMNYFAGSIGIGSTTPSSRLSVVGVSGSTSTLLTVASSTNASLFTVLPNGNVGVGTGTPSNKLDVSGTFRATGITTLATTTITNLTVTGTTTFSGPVQNIINSTSSVTVNATTTNLFATSSSILSAIFGSATSSFLAVQSTNSTPQMILSYDDIRTSTFQVDALGNLSIITSGGKISMYQDNLFVCVTNGACPSTGYSVTSAGNLVVEKKVVAGSYEQICPTGYIWVPGSTKYGTLPGFCTMKYEAKNVGGVPTSQPSGSPWTYIDQRAARTACASIGPDYHLTSDQEWMTIANNIISMPINNLNSTSTTLQFATGHSDNVPANALDSFSSLADPIVSGCDLMLPLGDAANAYSAGSCELRGNTTSYTSTSNDKGYYGTGDYFNLAYSAGGQNNSQLRTSVLSNGNVIWDMAGNVWEWTDSYVNSTSSKPSPVLEGWQQYNSILDYKGLQYIAPSIDNASSSIGVGQYYAAQSDGVRGFVRGADWHNGSTSGFFALNLGNSPSNKTTGTGFRCAK